MVDAVIEVVLAPALVAVATLAARRWGERLGGLVSAFPAIVGPVLLVSALEHGTAFAARAASGTLLGLVALAAFALVYGRAARRSGWPASLGLAWAAAGATGLAVSVADAGPIASLAAAAASLALAHRFLSGAREPAAAGPVEPPIAAAPAGPPVASPAQAIAAPRWDLPARMVLTAALVVSLTWAAGRLGPVAGGVLAALPVLASILAVFTHARLGADAVTALLRGMLAGMAGFVCFCALVAALAEAAGTATAFAAAAVSALAVQAMAARAGERAPGQPSPSCATFSGAQYEG
jgi:hypothetical protein